MAAPPSRREIVHQLCRLGVIPEGADRKETLNRLLDLTPADELSRTLKAAAERTRDADRATRQPVPGGRVDGVTGRKEPGYQLALAINWLFLGFWIAEPVDVAAWLTLDTARPDDQPPIGPFGPMPKPDATTVRGWISKLGLCRYEGRGRITYSQRTCAMLADEAMIIDIGAGVLGAKILGAQKTHP